MPSPFHEKGIALNHPIELPGRKTSRLFESLRIGPKVTWNRFYLAPHGIGLGTLDAEGSARVRANAARGGWGVVSTEQTEIGPATDMSPLREFQLFKPEHYRIAERICQGVQDAGALAALELSFSGCNVSNWTTWEAPIAATAGLVDDGAGFASPVGAIAADAFALKQVRDQQHAAARRAAEIGFDIVYVYASSVLSLPGQFLSPDYNRRTDQYGGSIRNRVRLIRELIEVTQDAVQGRAAVAVRMTLDDLLDPRDDYADLAEAFDEVGNLPDLWDLTIGGMGEDAGSARFNKSEQQTDTLKRVKALTTKPIAAVGFIASAEQMEGFLQDGIIDLIAAARASIADPELPNKLAAGRQEEVVHCIKCNVCVVCDTLGVTVRCTQNPSFGAVTDLATPPLLGAAARNTIAVVGCGPAGLEAAQVFVRRGYTVDLFDQRSQPGGRITDEAALPGLSLWRHVADDRIGALDRSGRARFHLGTTVMPDDLRHLDVAAVLLATGAMWERDLFGRCGDRPVTHTGALQIVSPEDIFNARPLGKAVTIYDAEGFYLAGVLAEHLVALGHRATFLTPWTEVSPFTRMTMEQMFVQRRLLNLGVDVKVTRRLTETVTGAVHHASIYTGALEVTATDTLLIVGSRRPNRALFDTGLTDTRPVELAGDAAGPGIIAQATASAHRAARRLLDRIA